MNRMIVANLVHRPVRSVISIIAIALEVTLILVIVGFSMGRLNDTVQRQLGIGADMMVSPPSSSVLVGMSGASMPVKVADRLKRDVPHIAVITPVYTKLTAGKSGMETIFGIDFPSYNALGNPFHFIAGGPFEQPFDVIVDDMFAQSKKGLKIGDQIKILNRDFRVVGIVEHGKGGRKFVPLTTLQDLTNTPAMCTLLYVKLDNPANIETVKQTILGIDLFKEYSVLSMQEWLTQMQPDTIPGLTAFINVVIGVSVIIGFIVIFQAMYTAVMERTREIGILKSLGASKLYIVNVILRETVLLAIGGIVVGIVFSLAARLGIIHRLPTLPLVVSGSWMLRAAIIAIVGAIAGALYPAYKAAQKDPIDALAYE